MKNCSIFYLVLLEKISFQSDVNCRGMAIILCGVGLFSVWCHLSLISITAPKKKKRIVDSMGGGIHTQRCPLGKYMVDSPSHRFHSYDSMGVQSTLKDVHWKVHWVTQAMESMPASNVPYSQYPSRKLYILLFICIVPHWLNF